jgi:hypothetical protein
MLSAVLIFPALRCKRADVLRDLQGSPRLDRFSAVCERDLEGAVAKRADGAYGAGLVQDSQSTLFAV